MPDGVISMIVSGGQTGVDRAALDAARCAGYPIAGWCPKGGWAEDLTEPPGLLARYPEMRQTPSPDVSQRTEWNVRDSSATLILCSETAHSPGTDFTAECALKYGKPYMVVDAQSPAEVAEWLRGRGSRLALNVAGPRESEAPGTYEKAMRFVKDLLKELKESEPSDS